MTCVLLAASIFAIAEPQQQPTPAGNAQQNVATANLDGTWTILYAAKDGQKIAHDRSATVTIRGNILTWSKDGKEHQTRLEFGANHALSAWKLTQESGDRNGAQNREPAGRSAAPAGQNNRTEAPGQAGNPAQPGTAQAAPGGRLPQPNQLATANGRTAAAPGQPVPNSGMTPHRGVFIEANEYLCIALDSGFLGEMHQPAGNAPNVRVPQNANQPDGQANNARPGAAAQAGNAPGAGQRGNENQVRPGEARTSNYPPDGQRALANRQSNEFVLILHREGGERQGQQR